jgi:hypothetical protein
MDPPTSVCALTASQIAALRQSTPIVTSLKDPMLQIVLEKVNACTDPEALVDNLLQNSPIFQLFAHKVLDTVHNK